MELSASYDPRKKTIPPSKTTTLSNDKIAVCPSKNNRCIAPTLSEEMGRKILFEKCG
jgi:hypothetical protein